MHGGVEESGTAVGDCSHRTPTKRLGHGFGDLVTPWVNVTEASDLSNSHKITIIQQEQLIK